eukprot:CAMPEP_0206217010 /NCGR_PEP_ID=MMETSP0047_2-20121206/3043_1 /ASSEMBLY_ACC=CAM_ASM_000192 /TAXON_ID=195065 /ORGANISM="Chroomonas mesostigmatica_cf, Strain CCMP1168" /LENGTH=139 /DNA_ID=CAMNT_0053639429 /DNA_START=74 /DNA_END=491 /DNA_ORIENTATION=+
MRCATRPMRCAFRINETHAPAHSTLTAKSLRCAHAPPQHPSSTPDALSRALPVVCEAAREAVLGREAQATCALSTRQFCRLANAARGRCDKREEGSSPLDRPAISASAPPISASLVIVDAWLFSTDSVPLRPAHQRQLG